jgi:penicillin-binding protein 2
MSLPGFRIGKRGIEKEYEHQIRGKAGASRVEVNAYGRVIRELGHDAGTPGSDVYLTIDQQVQQFAAQRLGNESAACAVLDVTNGDVIALVSSPGYDPNAFNVGISQTEWNALTTNDHKPLINKVITGEYPPGSTFKPVIAAGCMDNGLADLQVNCSGSMTLGNNVFHCWSWKKGGHGHVDLKRGIAVSCDIFFYEAAKRLGIDKIHDTAIAMGLGAKTGIELPGERPGLIPSREWKLHRFGVGWQQGETLNTGIGQGYVTATPIQLATLAARIASGNAVSPRITRYVGHAEQPRPQLNRLPFSDKALAAVQEGMNMVANVPGGTAYAWRITQPGFEMAGKTGTAQVRRITREDRAAGRVGNSGQPWKLREHALFIAYAPVQLPRYALGIIQEHGATPEHTHVQMARDILLFAQQRDPVKLPNAYPASAAENLKVRG